MITIEKGIPVPENAKSAAAYPFATMEVGDSFLAPKKTGSSAAMCVAKKTLAPKDFVSRVVEGGRRIWRTK